MDVLQALDARKGDPSVSLDLLPCVPEIFSTPSVGKHPQRCFSGLISDALWKSGDERCVYYCF
jgi:hypothetical protein